MDTRRVGRRALIAAAVGVGVVSASCTSTALPGPTPTKKGAGVSEWLFDGTSLDGWVRRAGKAEFFVENGQIVGQTKTGEPNSFLCTEREFGDFVLELEFFADSMLNSGIQIRSRAVVAKGIERVVGYQVEIDPSPRAWTSGIYEEGARGWLASIPDDAAVKSAFRAQSWNSLRIQAEGGRIRTWLNGVAGADLTDGSAARGFIGLQVHGVDKDSGTLRIRWRNIRLRELQ